MAGIVMCAGLLSGCAEDPPEPSTLDDKQTTSQEPSSTPTPTSTLSAEEQDAVEAATAAYHRFYEVVARLYKAPQDYTASQIQTELRRYGGGDAVDSKLQFLRSAQQRGWIQVGERRVERVSPDEVTSQPKVEGDYPAVVLRVCLDTSEIDLVDAATGESVTQSTDQTKWVNYVTVWYYEDAWQVVEERTGKEGEEC